MVTPLVAQTVLWLAGMGVPVLVAGIGWRAVMEERMLAAQLPGDADYAARVRYRLVPGIG